MDIQVRNIGDVTVLDLNGRLVMGQEKALVDSAHKLLESGHRYLAVNLAGVPLMDSSGIGAVVRVHTSTVRAGGKCRFFSAGKTVLQVLKMVRLDTLLDLSDDEAAALAGFK